MTDIGRAGMVMKGDYNSASTYETLDAVSYQNGLYVAKQNVPAGTVPTNTTYWQKGADADLVMSRKVSLYDNFVAPGNGIASLYILQNTGTASSTGILVTEDNNTLIFSYVKSWTNGWGGDTFLVPLRKGHTYTFVCDTSPASIDFSNNRTYFLY